MLERSASPNVAASDRATVLVGGFSSFPGVRSNPSEHLVGSLDRDGREGRICIESVVLPVEWERAWAVLEADIRRLRPSAVLLFGVNVASRCLRIERTARNERSTDRPDAAGRVAPSRTISDGQSTASSCLPVDSIARALIKAGIEFAWSDNAGNYLCNEVFFRLCVSAGELGVRQYGFVHTPMTRQPSGEEAYDVIDAGDLRRAALLMIESLGASL